MNGTHILSDQQKDFRIILGDRMKSVVKKIMMAVIAAAVIPFVMSSEVSAAALFLSMPLLFLMRISERSYRQDMIKTGTAFSMTTR